MAAPALAASTIRLPSALVVTAGAERGVRVVGSALVGVVVVLPVLVLKGTR